MLIHVTGTIFTDSETGATIDAGRAVNEAHRQAVEIQHLRGALGAIATAVFESCKHQTEKGRTLDNLNLDSIMNRVLREQAEKGSPVVTETEIIKVVSGLHKALSRMLEKHDPDSIEGEWLGESNEIIVKLTDHDTAGNNIHELRARLKAQASRSAARP